MWIEQDCIHSLQLDKLYIEKEETPNKRIVISMRHWSYFHYQKAGYKCMGARVICFSPYFHAHIIHTPHSTALRSKRTLRNWRRAHIVWNESDNNNKNRRKHLYLPVEYLRRYCKYRWIFNINFQAPISLNRIWLNSQKKNIMSNTDPFVSFWWLLHTNKWFMFDTYKIFFSTSSTSTSDIEI